VADIVEKLKDACVIAFFLCDFAEVDVIVTDAKAPADLITALRSQGLQVIVAGNPA